MPNYSGIRWRKFDSGRKNVVKNLFSLKEGLKSIPEKTTDKNFLLATWKIREFDGNKYGNRLEESFYYIAEVISSFDMVAVQEIRDDLVVFQDLDGYIKAFYKGNIIKVSTQIAMSFEVYNQVIIYKTNEYTWNAFYNGKTYEYLP